MATAGRGYHNVEFTKVRDFERNQLGKYNHLD